jgi:hypothetical protein
LFSIRRDERYFLLVHEGGDSINTLNSRQHKNR